MRTSAGKQRAQDCRSNRGAPPIRCLRCSGAEPIVRMNRYARVRTPRSCPGTARAFVLGRRTARRTYKQGLDAGAREFLDQKDLVRVSSTQAVGRIDKDGLDQSLGSKIEHPLEARTDQACAAITVVFEDPLRRRCELLLAGRLTALRYSATEMMRAGGDARDNRRKDLETHSICRRRRPAQQRWIAASRGVMGLSR